MCSNHEAQAFYNDFKLAVIKEKCFSLIIVGLLDKNLKEEKKKKN